MIPISHQIAPAEQVYDQALGVLTQTVLDAVTSGHTKRAYERALKDFFRWHKQHAKPPINRSLVQRYAAELHSAGASPASINQRLSALRKLALEAAHNGYLEQHIAAGIQTVNGVKQKGKRTGNWLVRDEAQALRDAPQGSRLKGLRDRALLAVLLGCGLRRSEAAHLQDSHLQQRDGRWAVVDLIGKGNRLRSVPMPGWAKAAVDEWQQAAQLKDGFVFRPVNKGGRVCGERMSSQAIHNVVKSYARELGLQGLAPHDLRRTFAKLAHKGGAPLEQIQLSLGHSSIRTTEQYVGVDQDFINAPCDHLGLR